MNRAVKRTRFGKPGLYLSVLPWLAMLWGMVFKPTWGSLFAYLAGMLIILAWPLGFILSLIGFFKDPHKKHARLGIISSVGYAMLFIIIPLVSFCF